MESPPEARPAPPTRPLRPFASLLWAAFFLVAIELALEVRATSRGFRATLLGRGPGVAQHDPTSTPIFGPTPNFPFRSRILTPAKAKAETSLWLASSSYGEDVYVPPTDLFATRLAENLAHPVINASHGGTTIASNTKELQRLGPDYGPRIVLLYQMSNDIDLYSERLAAGLPTAQTPGSGASAVQSFAPASKWIQSMTTYRQLKSHISSRLAEHLPLWDDLDAHVPAGSPTPAAAFQSDVLAFIDASRALGAEPVLITFATAYNERTAKEIPAAIVRQNLAMNIVLSPAGWTHAIATFNDVLRGIARERGVVCIDLAAKLEGKPELFRDLWHLTPEGHKRVAEILGDELEKQFPELAP